MAQNLAAYEVEVGQVYESPVSGVRVEVVEEEPGSKPLVVSKDDREGTERMSRYSFADMANYEDMELVEEADEDDEDDGEEVPHVSGEFDGPVTCPECGAFMWTGYDGMGLPAATCSRATCEFTGYDDADLKRRGLWAETDE